MKKLYINQMEMLEISLIQILEIIFLINIKIYVIKKFNFNKVKIKSRIWFFLIKIGIYYFLKILNIFNRLLTFCINKTYLG